MLQRRLYLNVQVDKLEQSDAVRSEEEAKATDKPLVFSKNKCSAVTLCVLAYFRVL